MRARAMGSIRVGDAVEAFVRPEVASLARVGAEPPAGGRCQYRAVVDSLLFDGANSAVLLHEQSSGASFRVALPQTGEFAHLTVGEAVAFSFDPQRAACFAADAGAGGGDGA
jgi:spermidine/putrescine transport system ATP-binding protein